MLLQQAFPNKHPRQLPLPRRSICIIIIISRLLVCLYDAIRSRISDVQTY